MEEETLKCRYCDRVSDPGYDTCYDCFSEGNCGACSDPDCPCSCACECVNLSTMMNQM